MSATRLRALRWGLSVATVCLAATARADTAKEHDLSTRTVGEVQHEGPEAKAAAEEEEKAAAEGDEGENTGEGRVIVPLVMYSPETHVGLGGLLVQFFRLGGAPPESRVSSVAFVVLVTTRRQAIFEIIPDVYWEDENYHLGVKLEYQRYPDSFFGIGARTRVADEERYERERLRFRSEATRRVVGSFFAGLSTDLMGFRGTYSDPDGIFATRRVPGEGGGFTSGVGPTVSYDTRDNAVSSRSGAFLSSSFLWFGRPIGSSYDFWKVFTQARLFFPVGLESALGLRYYGEFQGGNVPYYHLAMLGGDELLRGYFMGRYRDTDLVALEAEYRFPIIWRFGGVMFAGVGDVANRLSELDDSPLRFAGGGGFRLSLNSKERLNLRLDVGVAPNSYGIYFTAREAF
jgi:hypothetical protein